MKKAFLLLLCLEWAVSSVAQEFFVFSNGIEISERDSSETLIKKAAKVLPSERQYEWQKLELTGFIHFGLNTFTAREWGTGKESPTIFNPKQLDVKQWIATAKAAGMKLVMLTAKHHDGFCLWQTATTEHSVSNSPWKVGGGDLLREFVEAARGEGLKVGIYLSPADLHEIERDGGTYGNGSKASLRTIPSDSSQQATLPIIFSYRLDDYNALFMNQLYEVLTQYGEISEVWFDGANPKPGTGQQYAYKSWYKMIRELQPNAVIAIKGPDVRWVGNEAGKGRVNEWSVIPFQRFFKDITWQDRTEKDLGSRSQLEGAKYLHWYPAETDTPIREGWFYRDEKQYVKTVSELLNIWYESVGNNSVLLLNLSPNREGRIPAKDVQQVKEFGRIIRESFSNNLLEKATARIGNNNGDSILKSLVDKDLEKSWQLKEDSTFLTFEFKKPQEFDRIVIQEDIRNYGQRIEKFFLEKWENGIWNKIYESGTVGYKRIGKFPIQKTTKIRVKIDEYRDLPALGFIGIYKSLEILSPPSIMRDKQGVLRIEGAEGTTIYYTLDGTTPSTESMCYQEPFSLEKGASIKAIAIKGKAQSTVQEAHFDICASKWKAVASSFEQDFRAANAIDANPQTIWQTQKQSHCSLNFLGSFTIDLGEALSIFGFTYLPRQDGRDLGICTRYRLEGSLQGKKWELLGEGSFDNIENNPVQQTVLFSKHKLKSIRFTALETLGSLPSFSIAEIGIITK